METLNNTQSNPKNTTTQSKGWLAFLLLSLGLMAISTPAFADPVLGDTARANGVQYGMLPDFEVVFKAVVETPNIILTIARYLIMTLSVCGFFWCVLMLDYAHKQGSRTPPKWVSMRQVPNPANLFIAMGFSAVLFSFAYDFFGMSHGIKALTGQQMSSIYSVATYKTGSDDNLTILIWTTILAIFRLISFFAIWAGIRGLRNISLQKSDQSVKTEIGKIFGGILIFDIIWLYDAVLVNFLKVDPLRNILSLPFTP